MVGFRQTKAKNIFDKYGYQVVSLHDHDNTMLLRSLELKKQLGSTNLTNEPLNFLMRAVFGEVVPDDYIPSVDVWVKQDKDVEVKPGDIVWGEFSFHPWDSNKIGSLPSFTVTKKKQ